jgi:hypothetical protein
MNPAQIFKLCGRFEYYSEYEKERHKPQWAESSCGPAAQDRRGRLAQHAWPTALPGQPHAAAHAHGRSWPSACTAAVAALAMAAFGTIGELGRALLTMFGSAARGLRRQSSRKALQWRKKAATVAHPGVVDGDREVVDGQRHGGFVTCIDNYLRRSGVARLRPGLGDLRTGEEQSEARWHGTVNAASQQRLTHRRERGGGATYRGDGGNSVWTEAVGTPAPLKA